MIKFASECTERPVSINVNVSGEWYAKYNK